jgi:hypothetical protein
MIIIKIVTAHTCPPITSQPDWTNKFREFVSLPAQWHKERRRQQHNNKSGQMTRGSGKKTGRVTGRQEAGIAVHKLNNKN